MKENTTNICIPCDPPNDIQELDIKKGEYWKIGLHPNQAYLGRSVVILNRHIEDYFDTTLSEQKELNNLAKTLRNVLKDTFGADHLNYASLGNEVRHVHWHIIPRYSKSVVFGGITFEDKRWGNNYAPYENLLVPKAVLYDIRDEIKKRL